MIHDMVEIEAKATRRFAKVTEDLGYAKYSVDTTREHSGMFSAFFEVIIHDIPYENAKEYLKSLPNFILPTGKKLWGFKPFNFQIMISLN